MAYSITQAKNIVRHYQYLIGQDIKLISGNYPIHDILIVPEDPSQYDVFMSAYKVGADNQLLLNQSGYDPSAVRVVLIHYDGVVFYALDIEKYLSQKEINQVVSR